VQHNAPLDASLSAAAAARGWYRRNASDELDMLRYLHEVAHCPWDARTCNAAASMDNLELLSYAHDHGCPWDEKTCAKAAKNNAIECLTYAHEHGCPWDRNVSRAARQSPKCLTYCVEHGCPMTVKGMEMFNKYNSVVMTQTSL